MKGQRLITIAGIGLVGASVVQEIRKPAAERTWNGTLMGIFPYDYRMPTAERVAERLWSPEGPLFVPMIFGLGWTLNVGRLVAVLRGATGPGLEG